MVFEVPAAFDWLLASPPRRHCKNRARTRELRTLPKKVSSGKLGVPFRRAKRIWETFLVKRYDSRGNSVQSQEGGVTPRETFQQRRAKNLFEYMLPLTRKML